MTFKNIQQLGDVVNVGSGFSSLEQETYIVRIEQQCIEKAELM